MTLTINLPPDEETQLRLRAKANGVDASDYARQIIERKVSTRETKAPSSDASNASRAAVEDFLRRVERLEPDPNRPRLKGLEAQVEEGFAKRELEKRSQP